MRSAYSPPLDPAIIPDCRFVLEGLRKTYIPHHGLLESWAFFEELRVGTGYGHGSEQRIDAWAMNLYPSKGLARIAFEVKVSRSDFLRELKDPQKRRAALLCSNEFYFATPPGIVKREELPLEAGLIEVGDHSRMVVSAPWRDDNLPNWQFMASVMRRVFRMEQAAVQAIDTSKGWRAG